MNTLLQSKKYPPPVIGADDNDSPITPEPALRWEQAPCNLCGRDQAEPYHTERTRYFGRMLIFQIVRCSHCGLVYTNPRLAQHNANYQLQKQIQADDLEAHARAKTKIFIKSLDKIDTLLRQNQKNPPGNLGVKRLLDIGCGSGHFLDIARKKDYDVYGLEPARAYADYAQRRFGINVQNCTALEAEFAEGTFDVVTGWDVLEHLSDPKAVLRQCVNWLRPGGVTGFRFPSAVFSKLKSVLYKKLLKCDRAAFGANMHLFFFNEDTFSKMAQQVGLEVLRVETTAMEANTPSLMLNLAKTGSAAVIWGAQMFCGKHLGNLEVYCRKQT